jgi:hypothetical protein
MFLLHLSKRILLASDCLSLAGIAGRADCRVSDISTTTFYWALGGIVACQIPRANILLLPNLAKTLRW